MSFLPANARPGRRKLFTSGRQPPIDRNDRAKLMLLADESRRRGNITRAAVDIMRALLFQFANMKDGRCIPSYARLAEAAGCCERTVGRCLAALEDVGLVAWIHRVRRIKETVAGALVTRVVRTSNSYNFPSIKNPAFSSNGQNGRGTTIPDSKITITPAAPIETGLGAALLRYQAARERRMQPA
jgi:hypothetical protein